jgi:hypothetical protein
MKSVFKLSRFVPYSLVLGVSILGLARAAWILGLARSELRPFAVPSSVWWRWSGLIVAALANWLLRRHMRRRTAFGLVVAAVVCGVGLITETSAAPPLNTALFRDASSALTWWGIMTGAFTASSLLAASGLVRLAVLWNQAPPHTDDWCEPPPTKVSSILRFRGITTLVIAAVTAAVVTLVLKHMSQGLDKWALLALLTCVALRFLLSALSALRGLAALPSRRQSRSVAFQIACPTGASDIRTELCGTGWKTSWKQHYALIDDSTCPPLLAPVVESMTCPADLLRGLPEQGHRYPAGREDAIPSRPGGPGLASALTSRACEGL